MSEGRKLTVNVDANTSKLQLKLKAIAKHAEALANELEEIDKACDCGGMSYTTVYQDDKPYMKVCDGCGEAYVNDEVHKATS